MTAPTRIPEGMTDPDEIDRWLEERDARALQKAADRDVDDAAVMAELPRYHPATDPVVADAILARREYGELRFWQRWRHPVPPGYYAPHAVRVDW